MPFLFSTLPLLSEESRGFRVSIRRRAAFPGAMISFPKSLLQPTLLSCYTIE